MKNLIYLCFVAFMVFVACDSESVIPEVEDGDVVDEVVVDDEVVDDGEDTSDAIPDLPYDEIPQTQYTIDVDYWDIPTDGTEAEQTTDNLQAAIDWAVEEGYGVIRLPAGHYLIGKYGNSVYQAGIELKSNMAFILDDDAIIEMAPNDKPHYYIIRVTGQEYVFISGGTILGDRDEHIYDDSITNEYGMCIAITEESEYVTVEGMSLSNGTGDGILLKGEAGEGSSVKHIDILGNDIFNNRRQGISIVGGEDVVIEDNEIHHIEGTAPQFGIDIESEIYYSNNIEIRSNYFHHNSGGHIINFDAWNLVIEDNVMEDGEGYEHQRSVIYYNNTAPTIRNNEISFISPESSNSGCGIASYPNESSKTNAAITQIYGNTLSECSVYMYEGGDLNIYENKLTNGTLGFSDMTNVTLTDNIVENENGLFGMNFSQVTGSASGNVLNGESVTIPLGTEPYDGYFR